MGHLSNRLASVVVLTGFVLVGCGKKDSNAGGAPPPSQGAPPPVEASGAKPGACKDGGGQVKDAVSSGFFARQAGSFCVNPEGETKAFGEHASQPIKGICGLFDGGCEVYLTNQVKRVVSVDYVDERGSPATVNAILSQFATADYAYAMFTHRVTGDEDPARADMPKLKKLSGYEGAIGTGTLYVAKGAYLVELSYVNTDEDEKSTRASAENALPAIANSIVTKLPSAASAPMAVQALPEPNRLPLGVTYQTEKVLGVEGTGTGAVGYYKDADKRYRVLAIVKADEAQAKDVLTTFGKRKGATTEKEDKGGTVRLMIQNDPEEPKSEWVIGRHGAIVLGIGDEPYAVKPGASAAEHEKANLSKDEKVKRLRAWLLGKLPL